MSKPQGIHLYYLRDRVPRSKAQLALIFTPFYLVTARDQGKLWRTISTVQSLFLRNHKVVFEFHTLQAQTYNSREGTYITLGLNTKRPIQWCAIDKSVERRKEQLFNSWGSFYGWSLSCPRNWKCAVSTNPHHTARCSLLCRGPSTTSSSRPVY